MTSSTRETAYHEALGSLYDTALDSGAWAQFMTRFAGAVGACGAQYLVWSDASNSIPQRPPCRQRSKWRRR